jgi:hypothetical protein
MESSYQQLGGKDTVKFSKGLRQNFKDHKSMQDYSQLEMSRNLFQPSKSKFLSGDMYDEQMEPMEKDIINSRYMSQSVQQNVDLSRSLIKFVENERKRESRNNILGKEVRNIVSYLQDNEIDSEKLHNISGLLMDDSTPYMTAADKIKQKQANPKSILKKKSGIGVPSDALEPIAEVSEKLSKKSKSKKDKKEKKPKREKKPKKEKKPKSAREKKSSKDKAAK